MMVQLTNAKSIYRRHFFRAVMSVFMQQRPLKPVHESLNLALRLRVRSFWVYSNNSWSRILIKNCMGFLEPKELIFQSRYELDS